MPGSVASATTSLVLPLSLSRAFSHSRLYTVRVNQYPNGESQRRSITTTSRKSWRLDKRLTPAEYDTLLAFYQSTHGPVLPFYFYDGTETSPLWSWDATGVATTGRYMVRFANEVWQAEFSLPRHNLSIELIEVA